MIRTVQGLTGVAVALLALSLRPPPAMSQTTMKSAAPADSSHQRTHGGKHSGTADSGKKRLSYDAATRTVTFKLVAGRAKGESRLNFNGYSNGQATLVVPSASHVVITVVNKDSVPHSAAIVEDRDPLPAKVDRAALVGAATKDLIQGLPHKGTDVMRFTAPAGGRYRIVSGVPGQARAGMWIRFRVDSAAPAPDWLKNH